VRWFSLTNPSPRSASLSRPLPQGERGRLAHALVTPAPEPGLGFYFGSVEGSWTPDQVRGDGSLLYGEPHSIPVISVNAGTQLPVSSLRSWTPTFAGATKLSSLDQ
jgi:hypothetical protein